MAELGAESNTVLAGLFCDVKTKGNNINLEKALPTNVWNIVKLLEEEGYDETIEIYLPLVQRINNQKLIDELNDLAMGSFLTRDSVFDEVMSNHRSFRFFFFQVRQFTDSATAVYQHQDNADIFVGVLPLPNSVNFRRTERLFVVCVWVLVFVLDESTMLCKWLFLISLNCMEYNSSQSLYKAI